ncbi:MAG: hypothetical protein II963_02400 [Bacteroidales bacterium]|nr:hypothetical protein [Bacteroidales bacterium]MBQ6081074.1 hypothetical protein [Bacteroidales bacterium]
MKRLLTICLLAAISLGTFAQDKECKQEKMHEKFQADKVAFLSQKMDLSVKEAEAFWPIYNEYSKASEEVHKDIMDAVGIIHKAEELSDAEASAAIDALLAAQKKENDLQSQYTERFKKVLPVKKVAAFFAAEDAFRKHLFRQFKDKERPGKPGDKRPFDGRKKPAQKEPADKTQK